jgi:AAHS family 3-hydroxyphenylpropionic acid transporter
MTAAATSAKARGGGGLVLAICLSVAVLEGYDIQAFGVAAPRLAPELGLNPSQVGLAGAAAVMGLVLAALAGGWVSDRVGRKPVLFWSVAAFGVFSLAAAAVKSYELLLLVRFLAGLGFGGAMPNLVAIATEISPPERRAATVTAITAGMPTGGALVSLGAGALAAGEWRPLFLIGGVLPLLILPLLHFALPETRPSAAPDADRRVLKALFGDGQAMATLLLWVVFMLTLVVLFLMLNWLPSLVVAKGYSQADGATAALAFNFMAAVGTVTMGVIADRTGYRVLLTLAFLALAVALWAMTRAAGLGAVIGLSAVIGVLVVGAQFTLLALTPSFYAPEVRAGGTGAAIAVGRIGSILGPLLAGELRNSGFTADQVFLVLTPAAVAAAVGVLILTTFGRTRPT